MTLEWPWLILRQGQIWLGQDIRWAFTGPLVLWFLFPRHLCGYSFHLSVRLFVRSYVHLFVRSYFRHICRILYQSYTSKFLKWCISQQLHIRKQSYLDHSNPGGLAFTPWPRTPGSMPMGGATSKSVFSKFCYGITLLYPPPPPPARKRSLGGYTVFSLY